MALGTILQSIYPSVESSVVTAAWPSPAFPERITFARQSEARMPCSKGARQGQDFFFSRKHVGADACPVLQLHSTAVSIPCASPCHMQSLILLEATENSHPGGKEDEGGLTGTVTAGANNSGAQGVSHTLLPPATHHRQAPRCPSLQKCLVTNSACGNCPGTYLAHRQMEWGGYELCHAGHQNKRLLITLSCIGGLAR